MTTSKARKATPAASKQAEVREAAKASVAKALNPSIGVGGTGKVVQLEKRPEPTAVEIKQATYWLGAFPPGEREVRKEGAVMPEVVEDYEVRPRSPAGTIHLGMASFHSVTTPPVRKTAAKGVERARYFGMIQVLNTVQVESVIDYANRGWVRWVSRRGKRGDWGHILFEPTEDQIQLERLAAEARKEPYQPTTFVRQSGDEPIGKYLYMIKVADGLVYPPQVANSDLPPSILETGIELP